MSEPEARADPLPSCTPRLVLRRFAAADAETFCSYRSDPLVAEYQGWVTCNPEQAVEFVRCHAARPFGLPGEWLQIAVALRHTNALIGDFGLKIHSDARQATVGFTFARSHQRQGYATEALSCLLDLLFLRLNLHRVAADTDVKNVAAWKLMERCGLRREGHLRESLWFKGRWADEYLYAIRDEEWSERRRATSLS